MNINLDIENEAVSSLMPKFAFENNVLPIKKVNGDLLVGITNANNKKLIHEIGFNTGLKVEAQELPSELILQKLKEIYPDYKYENGNGGSQVATNISDYSTVEFVNQIISDAIKSRASDIHFESLENSFRVRFRIDGQLREVANLPKSKNASISSRLKIMANLDISEKRRPQDGRIKYKNNGFDIDIRVSSLPTSFGEKIVLRILDKSQLRLDLKKLGLSKDQNELLHKKINLPYGMILVTGPTGSGKTTTLYAALQEIHSEDKNILTVEDPIEYNLDGINQCNVKSDIGFDFANALRSFLRQDPDVVMVGEIRDKETAEIAIRASLTGHLVFSTLHTNDSISAIARLIDMGIEPFLVAASVKLIIAQRLVRVLCDCKKANENEELNKKFELVNIYDRNGCSKCNYNGFKGRSAIYEMLDISEKLADAISANKSNSELKKIASLNGLKTLRDSGYEKIKNGITTYEEVARETL